MLLGFGRAVGRFMGYQPPDLAEAFRLGLQNPDHPDFVELFHAELKPPSPDEDDLDHELATADRYLALFEALNWGISLDDRLTKDWPFDEVEFGDYWCDDFAGGDLIRGLRHARNAVHHDWSLALDVDPQNVILQQRIELLWLCWIPDLKSGRPSIEGERTYRENLAGRVVGDTLLEINELLAAGVNFAMGRLPTHMKGPARVKRSAGDRYIVEEDF